MQTEATALRTDVLGVAFDDLTLPGAAGYGAQLLACEGFHYAVTPNPEIVMTAQKDAEYAAILNGADLVLPDGIGVIKAASLLGTPLKERVPGIDFACALLERESGRGLRLYLLGAKPGIAEQAGDALTEKYPGLVICGTHDGYFQESESDAIAAEIRRSGAELVFVCLGAPKQEKWIAAHGEATGARLLIGLGGVLDVFAGVTERAPEKWQKLGLEWFYRLCKEPKRIGRMAKLPLFLVQAARVRLTGGKKEKA